MNNIGEKQVKNEVSDEISAINEVKINEVLTQNNPTVTVELTVERAKNFLKEQKKAAKTAKNNANTGNDEQQDSETESRFIRLKKHLNKHYDFKMNSISNDIYYKKKSNTDFEILNESDLLCHLYESGFLRFQTELAALLGSNFVPKHNPFVDYFQNLPQWDEKTDYIEQLANCVKSKKTENQGWFNSQFKKMLVRMVAQALHKIDFNKHCFTLIGKQNDGKSSFLRFLNPPKLANYYTEKLEFMNKDGRFALCQNFIINLDELANLSRFDINQVKSFFSTTTVKDRLPFDKKPSNFLRCANFLSSTNNKEFLTDTTGNVRWLVFEISNIDFNYDKIDIDLVYSQAYALLKSGFDCKLTQKEIEFADQINQSHQVVTAEMELLTTYYEPANKDTEGTVFMTTTEILHELTTWYSKLGLNTKKLGEALKFLKFEQTQKFDSSKGYQNKGYYLKNIKSFINP